MGFEGKKKPPAFVKEVKEKDPKRFKAMASAGGKKSAEVREKKKEEAEILDELREEARLAEEAAALATAAARHDDLLPEDD